MSVIVLIPAAGMGRRMQAAHNKQYLLLDGIPILAHTLALFNNHPLVDHIYVVSPVDEIPFCRREIVSRLAFDKVREVVAGGEERQDSVRNGLRSCDAQADDIVLIHDGVRPLFPARCLPEVIETTARVGACVVGMPVKDTIKEVDDHLICATPDRGRLWQAQTPQGFRYALIRDAHERALADDWRGTDDASLVERLGLPVAMVAGSYRNIKITTPEDLILAEALLRTDEERRV